MSAHAKYNHWYAKIHHSINITPCTYKLTTKVTDIVSKSWIWPLPLRPRYVSIYSLIPFTYWRLQSTLKMTQEYLGKHKQAVWLLPATTLILHMQKIRKLVEFNLRLASPLRCLWPDDVQLTGAVFHSWRRIQLSENSPQTLFIIHARVTFHIGLQRQCHNANEFHSLQKTNITTCKQTQLVNRKQDAHAQLM